MTLNLQNFWKLGLFFLITECYSFWCLHKGIVNKSKTETFYELEANFYQCLLRCVVNNLAFNFIMLFAFFLKNSIYLKLGSFPYFSLWKGMIISGYTTLFELCRLIWSCSTQGPRIHFQQTLFIMSMTRCYKGEMFDFSSGRAFCHLTRKSETIICRLLFITLESMNNFTSVFRNKFLIVPLYQRCNGCT